MSLVSDFTLSVPCPRPGFTPLGPRTGFTPPPIIIVNVQVLVTPLNIVLLMKNTDPY